MLFPIVIHKDATSDYGVTVPDLPGCFSAGETFEEALAMVREAIELHLEGLIEDGDALPVPRSIEEHRASGNYSDGTWAVVEVNVDELMGPAERINITVPRYALRRIDEAAKRVGMNRSQYLTSAGLKLTLRQAGNNNHVA